MKFAACLLLIGSIFSTLAVSAADLRIGMIGLDTSHVTVFTKTFNDTNFPSHIRGAKVVAAFKGGSPDIPSSADRLEGYTKTLRDQYGVKIVDSIEELCTMVDVVMLESVDGRPHLAQALPVIKARKPLFIDKPVAGSLSDAIQIFKAAKDNNVPVFSSSSLRFWNSVQVLKKEPKYGTLNNVISAGPAHLQQYHPDLFWYAIHCTEAMFTVIGPGCETVTATVTQDSHIVTGKWNDGRTGTVVGIRNGASPYKLTVFGTKDVVDTKLSGDYTPMLKEILKFFQTGVAPITPEETLEIFAFMEAADESKRQGGCPVKIADVMKKAGATH